MDGRPSGDKIFTENYLLRLRIKYKKANSQVLCQHRMRYHVMPEVPYHPPELPLVHNQKSKGITTPDHAQGRRNLVEQDTGCQLDISIRKLQALDRLFP